MSTQWVPATFTVTTGAQSAPPPVEAKPVSPFISIDDPEELEPHQDPYEAAKEIRVLARQLMDQPGDNSESKSYLSNVKAYQVDESYWIARLEEVIPTRRVAEIKGVLANLKQVRKSTKSYVEYAYNTGDGSYNAETAEQIHKLAQSLPTVPGAPVMPFEQTLRAIATLLKNAGFFNLNEKGQPEPINYSEPGDDDYVEDDE